MKFPVILADPPWKFERWGNDTGSRATERYYPTMTCAEIGDLAVPDLCAENAVLFLWASWPMIEQAFSLMKAWDFVYKTCAWTWVKLNPSGLGFHFGMGYYTRANPEPCLLATRGRMPVAAHNVPSLIVSPRRQHSRKPDEQYAMIERLYPIGPHLELFARRKHPGWYAWGNEIESDVEIHFCEGDMK